MPDTSTTKSTEREIMTITEVQNKNITRIYDIVGPKPETVKSFWDYLVAQGVIESYAIGE